jgi:hypothetical protein
MFFPIPNCPSDVISFPFAKGLLDQFLFSRYLVYQTFLFYLLVLIKFLAIPPVSTLLGLMEEEHLNILG